MPTTIFDASLITQRARDKVIAQQVQQANRSGNSIITPQSGYGSYLCGEYANGAITYFRKNGGCTDVDLACSCDAAIGGANNIINTNPQYTITIDVPNDSLTVSIAITGNGTIYWDDGSSESFDTGSNINALIHTYAVGGIYNIVIATFITKLQLFRVQKSISDIEYEYGVGDDILNYPKVLKINLENAYGLETLIANNDTLIEVNGLTSCTNLKTLQLYNNSFNLSDIALLTQLESLYLTQNSNITNNFNVSNIFPTSLKELSFNNCSSLNSVIGLSSLINLEQFGLNNLNNLTDVDLSFNTNLNVANFNGTYISSIPNIIINNTEILGIANTLITGNIDMTQYVNLKKFNIGGTNISSLNVTNLEKLTYLGCYQTGISSLNLSGLSTLKHLDCFQTGISSLNLSGLSTLNILNCSETGISSLNLSGLLSLEGLNCSQTGISSLDLSGLSSLIRLDCSQIGISSLNLSGLSDLTYLYCSKTGISSLNLTGLSTLYNLDCYNCNLNPSSVSTIGNQLIPSNAGICIISTASQQTPFTIVSTIAPWTTLSTSGWNITF